MGCGCGTTVCKIHKRVDPRKNPSSELMSCQHLLGISSDLTQNNYASHYSVLEKFGNKWVSDFQVDFKKNIYFSFFFFVQKNHIPDSIKKSICVSIVISFSSRRKYFKCLIDQFLISASILNRTTKPRHLNIVEFVLLHTSCHIHARMLEHKES